MSTLLSIAAAFIALATIVAAVVAAWPAHWPDPVAWAWSASYRSACRVAAERRRAYRDHRSTHTRAITERREARHG